MVVARLGLGCNEVGGIIKCQNIDKGYQLSQGGQSGKDIVRYVQRQWGIHIYMTSKD
jgi:hypothetical protein